VSKAWPAVTALVVAVAASYLVLLPLVRSLQPAPKFPQSTQAYTTLTPVSSQAYRFTSERKGVLKKKRQHHARRHAHVAQAHSVAPQSTTSSPPVRIIPTPPVQPRSPAPVSTPHRSRTISPVGGESSNAGFAGNSGGGSPATVGGSSGSPPATP